MEYSREDSLRAWEANADFWDSYMGDQSNQFHREAVRPGVTELLDPRPGDFITRRIWRNAARGWSLLTIRPE